MSGLFLAGVMLALVAACVTKDEMAARKRRQRLQKRDPLGIRLREPAYLRKTMPRTR